MRNLIISIKIGTKLREKHRILRADIEQAFLNREGAFLQDTRAQHLTHPVTEWFIAETDAGLLLKVVFVEVEGQLLLRTAYPANEDEIRIYEKFAY